MTSYDLIKYAEYLYDCTESELHEFATKNMLDGRAFFKQGWTYNVFVTFAGDKYEARLEWCAPEDHDDGPHYHPGLPGWWVKKNGLHVSDIPASVAEAMLSLVANFYESCIAGVA